MFEYFPNNYPWSLAVMGALSRGGVIGEVDEACRPLREIAAEKNDPAAQIAWFVGGGGGGGRVGGLGEGDGEKHPPRAPGPQDRPRRPLLPVGRPRAEPQGSAP